MKCPKCGTSNSDSTDKCACGFVFDSIETRAMYAPGRKNGVRYSTDFIFISLMILVLVIIIPYTFFRAIFMGFSDSQSNLFQKNPRVTQLSENLELLRVAAKNPSHKERSNSMVPIEVKTLRKNGAEGLSFLQTSFMPLKIFVVISNSMTHKQETYKWILNPGQTSVVESSQGSTFYKGDEVKVWSPGYQAIFYKVP